MYLRTVNLYTKQYVEDTFTLEELDGMSEVSKLADEFKDTSAVLKDKISSSAKIKNNYDTDAEIAEGYQVVIECPNR